MNKLAVVSWLVLLGAGALALAQDETPSTEPDSLAEARAELAKAREAVEAAAREVARLSAEHVGTLGDGTFMRRMAAFRRPLLLGLNIENRDGGVGVVGVTPNGPAAQAGIATGDVLVAIDGEALDTSGGRRPVAVLLEQLADVEPGAVVTLDVARGDENLTIPVTTSSTETASVWLEELRGLGPALQHLEPLGRNFGIFRTPFAGAAWRDMELVELTPALGAYFGATEGLLVVRAPADDTLALADGDVILSIGGRTPSSVEHAMRILASFEPGEALELEIMREQGRRTLEIEMPARDSEAAVVR